MDNDKILLPFQSETYKNIQERYADLVNMLNEYLVLALPFKNQMNEVLLLLDSAEEDYNKELEQWLNNPQNTCEHENVQHKYISDNMYEIVCKDCGKVLATFKS